MSQITDRNNIFNSSRQSLTEQVELEYEPEYEELELLEEAVCPVASAGKIFTAYLVADAVEKKLLDFSAPARDYLPKKLQSKLPNNITVLDLVHHTSGLVNYTSVNFNPRISYTYNLKEFGDTKKSFFYPIRGFKADKTHTYEYSNTNYIWLQEILKSVYGVKNFPKFVKEHFSSLGLTSVQLGLTPNFEPLGNLVLVDENGKEIQRQCLENFHDFRLVDRLADGGFMCSQKDLEIFLRKLFIDRELLPETNLDETLVPTGDQGISYGLGFLKNTADASFSHVGICTGHQALWYVKPKQELEEAEIIVYTENVSQVSNEAGLGFHDASFDLWVEQQKNSK